jgi:uncharacterized protein (TIGR00369 family)
MKQNPSPNPEYVDGIMKIINKSPFPNHIAMKLLSLEIDRAELAVELNKNHLQAYGIVHGGVLATMIDTATFWAVYLRIPEDAGLVNIDLKLNYLKSVRNGKIRAVGTCIRPGKTISYAEATVFDEKGDRIAHGTSSLMTLPGKGLKVEVPKLLSPA